MGWLTKLIPIWQKRAAEKQAAAPAAAEKRFWDARSRPASGPSQAAPGTTSVGPAGSLGQAANVGAETEEERKKKRGGLVGGAAY